MKQGKWLRCYKQRLIERGLDEQLAEEATGAVDLADVNLLIDSPEDIADDEQSYWLE